MDELEIKQEINESLKILFNHIKADKGRGVTVSKDDLVFLAGTFKHLIEFTNILDLCDFCARPCLGQPYGTQICCENYHDQWTL